MSSPVSLSSSYFCKCSNTSINLKAIDRFLAISGEADLHNQDEQYLEKDEEIKWDDCRCESLTNDNNNNGATISTNIDSQSIKQLISNTNETSFKELLTKSNQTYFKYKIKLSNSTALNKVNSKWSYSHVKIKYPKLVGTIEHLTNDDKTFISINKYSTGLSSSLTTHQSTFRLHNKIAFAPSTPCSESTLVDTMQSSHSSSSSSSSNFNYSSAVFKIFLILNQAELIKDLAKEKSDDSIYSNIFDLILPEISPSEQAESDDFKIGLKLDSNLDQRLFINRLESKYETYFSNRPRSILSIEEEMNKEAILNLRFNSIIRKLVATSNKDKFVKPVNISSSSSASPNDASIPAATSATSDSAQAGNTIDIGKPKKNKNIPLSNQISNDIFGFEELNENNLDQTLQSDDSDLDEDDKHFTSSSNSSNQTRPTSISIGAGASRSSSLQTDNNKYSCSLPRDIPFLLSTNKFNNKTNYKNENKRHKITNELSELEEDQENQELEDVTDDFDDNDDKSDMRTKISTLASSIVAKDGRELFGGVPSRRIPINSISQSYF